LSGRDNSPFARRAGTTDKALQLRFLRHLVNRLPPINKSLLQYGPRDPDDDGGGGGGGGDDDDDDDCC
jgi:hypothetical protein